MMDVSAYQILLFKPVLKYKKIIGSKMFRFFDKN